MQLPLIRKQKEAKGTYSFYFDNRNKIKYLPGQYFYFTLPQLNYDDARGPTRHFTISSSPSEKEFKFTTRIREKSGYKKTLFELPMGTNLEVEGPNGTFILDENEKGEHILIAGGIGITPFRSFIKYNLDKDLGTQMHLIYSNSIPEEIAFENELKAFSSNVNFITVDMTVTKPEESKINWSGLTGRVDSNLLNKLLLDLKNKTYWIAGPPAMVSAIEATLSELKIPGDKVKSDKFSGY